MPVHVRGGRARAPAICRLLMPPGHQCGSDTEAPPAMGSVDMTNRLGQATKPAGAV